ncbi:MAG: hypothetical protein H5T86_09190 [Armatimonadetes bacterium]|nr:hypothetical protein [Armatimonadota bacterium]
MAGLIALLHLALAAVQGQTPDFDRNGVVDEADLVYFIRQYAQRAGNWDRAVDLKRDNTLNHEDALRMIDALLQAGSAEAVQLAATLRATGEKFVEVGSAKPSNPDFQGFVAWLRARNDIATAEAQEEGVAAITRTGVNLFFTVRDVGTLGALSPAPAAAATTSRVPFNSTEAVHPAALTRYGELVPRGEALLIDVVHNDAQPFIADVSDMLRRAGYNCVEKPPGLSSFANMKDAEITVVKSHGGIWRDATGTRHFAFYAEYRRFDEPIPDLRPFLRELHDGSLLLGCDLHVDRRTNRVTAWFFVAIVADRWFPRNLGSLPANAAIFFMMCKSAALDEPAQTFFNMGAQAYFGFTDTVENAWATAWVKKYIDRLTGANITEEWDRPPRRPQSFSAAFDYIRGHAEYAADPGWGAKPKLCLADRPELDFSLATHIDMAVLAPTLEGGYVLHIAGALGRSPRVYQDGKVRSIVQAGTHGGYVAVSIPSQSPGEVWVETEDGRKSNRVVVSRMEARVRIDVDDWHVLPCSGTIRLRYTELVFAQRLYDTVTRRMRFGGWASPELDPAIPRPLPYHPLCGGWGEWELEWTFDSTRTVGDTTYRVVGSGATRGSPPLAENEPHATFVVLLSPAETEPAARSCTQSVRVGVRVGPLRIIQSDPDGTLETEELLWFQGMAEGTYDIIAGQLQSIDAPLALDVGTWHMDAVQLTPPPPGLDQVALGPEPWARGLELARLWPRRSSG